MTRRTIVFDFETTGLSPGRGDRVIEVGAVALHGDEIVEEFGTLVNAGHPVSWRAQQVHGISSEMLVDAPLAADVFGDFRNFIGSAPLVAHNAAFDTRFLAAEFARLGYELANPIHCTLQLARVKCPTLTDHKLATLFRYLGGVLPQAAQLHRALDDARIAAFVWQRLNQLD